MSHVYFRYWVFNIQGAPKTMICHYFFHKVGGFSLDQLAIIYVVIVCHLREGGKPNLLHDVPKSADFFKGPDPLFCKSLFNSIIFNYKCILFFSGSMLRINAEPSFFTEIFTELKSVGAHTEFRT